MLPCADRQSRWISIVACEAFQASQRASLCGRARPTMAIEVSHEGVVSMLRWGNGQRDQLFHSITGEKALVDGDYDVVLLNGVGMPQPRNGSDGAPKWVNNILEYSVHRLANGALILWSRAKEEDASIDELQTEIKPFVVQHTWNHKRFTWELYEHRLCVGKT